MTSSIDNMAEITDINESPGIQNSRLMISYPENITDVTKMSIHVMGVLQSTLELEKLIEYIEFEIGPVMN